MPSRSSAHAASPVLDRRRLLAGSATALLTGCFPENPSEPDEATPGGESRPQTPLRIAIVDDSPLGEAIGQQWAARASTQLKIQPFTREELLGRKTLSTDLVIYPNGLLGELIEREFLSPLPAEMLTGVALSQNEVFQLLRLRETNWGSGVFAAPLGSPVFTLGYRPDVFTQLGVRPPQTWAEYGRIAQAAQGAKPAGQQDWSGTLEPLAGKWAAETMLARGACYARRRDTLACLFDLDMAPQIATAPFLRAVEELVVLAKNTPSALEMAPADVANALLEGRAAMGLTWLHANIPERTPPIGLAFAELPGSRESYSQRIKAWEKRSSDDSGRVTLVGIAGRMGSLTRLCGQPREAARALALLSSGEWSARVSPASEATAPFRDLHATSIQRWAGGVEASAANSYFEVVESSLQRTDWLFSPRIPGREDYLASLAEAVRLAVQGRLPPQDALDQASSEWQTITDALGRDSQKKAYRDSLVR